MKIDEQFHTLGLKTEEDIKSIKQKTKIELEAKEIEIQETKRLNKSEKNNLEQIEIKMKMEIKFLTQRNKQLEDEINTTNSKLRESIELNSCLKSKVNNAKILTDRLLVIEAYPRVTETDTSLDIIKNLEDLARVNKELRDRNKELELKMISNALEDW